MVMQRDMPNTFWGWTQPGQKVTISVDGHSASGVAGSDGKWVARVSPPPVGGPYTVKIDGPSHAELDDVLVGDVWICSGQSNMEFGIGNANNAKEEIKAADHPNMRLYMLDRAASFVPLTQGNGTWKVCDPQSVAQGGWNGFSAVGYFFGRTLEEHLKIPIGLIETNWGGTVAEAWTSEASLRKLKDFDPRLNQVASQVDGIDQSNASWPLKAGDPNVPTVLYNGMIAPIAPLAIKGAIWYQGEANVGRAAQYERLLPAMIEDWRETWGEPNFPFFIVQLANYSTRHQEPADDPWPELREAQTFTANHVKNAGLAVTIDIGDGADIHPKDKQDVGKRLALAALHTAYGEDLVYSGPVYQSKESVGSTLVVSFHHTDGGLKADGPPKGFQLAGPDHKFHWAEAKIVGNTVVLSSSDVSNPVDVRYAWDADPEATLYNGAGLPAVPFRTR
jgi:sialate O-acetylesterase